MECRVQKSFVVNQCNPVLTPWALAHNVLFRPSVAMPGCGPGGRTRMASIMWPPMCLGKVPYWPMDCRANGWPIWWGAMLAWRPTAGKKLGDNINRRKGFAAITVWVVILLHHSNYSKTPSSKSFLASKNIWKCDNLFLLLTGKNPLTFLLLKKLKQ